MKAPVSSPATRRWQAKLAKAIEPEPRYLIPALQYVQSEAGYLPPEAMTAVAMHLGVSEAKVFGVASFYAQFYFEPRGRNTITVCRGTACHVRGSGALLKELESRLRVKAGGTTEDLSFSLETVACYGSCALAPVVVLNEVVHRQQTTASIPKLLATAGTDASQGRKKPVKGQAGRRRGKGKKGARS